VMAYLSGCVGRGGWFMGVRCSGSPKSLVGKGCRPGILICNGLGVMSFVC
jgi:hypothetical protein